MNAQPERASPEGVSRRTVTKALAWTLPTIAVAAAAPAYAASLAILTGTDAACKLPGNSQNLYKGYALGIAAHNPYDVSILISIDSLILNGADLGNLQVINLNGCIKLGANSFAVPASTDLPNLVVLTKEAVNSQAGTLTATYTVTGGPGGTVTVSATIAAVPPIQSGACNGFTEEEKSCIAQQNRVE